MDISQAVSNIKELIETAIVNGGTVGKNNLIRSSQPINQIHELVKSDLVRHKVIRSLIKPPLGQSQGEVNVYGFLKKKSQDVSVINTGRGKSPEKLLMGTDPLGVPYTESILSINIRSQLSSAAKNFDTLYERTFAESINLHMRCPRMVLGEVYMIAVREYDIPSSDRNIVSFKPLDRNIRNHVEKYIHYFNLLNMRTSVVDDFYKYEQICLLLVDFSTDIPKVYNTSEELKRDNLLSPNSTANMENLSFPTFTKSIVDIYRERFGEGIFIRS